ncbi:MAG: HAMP domain-containing protein [Cytophagales bacterium]|nr:MAG: HAMP domain-containing protein [Cytophagales bacterium]TAF60661.1 MAG: HAMP domain-containing protein [Cytophagales bacterium]
MLKINLSIWQKIFGSFILLLIIMGVISVIAVVSINRNEDLIAKENTIFRPSFEELKALEAMLARSKMYITTWLYTPHDKDEKSALRNLQTEEYPTLKRSIVKLSEQWPKQEDKQLLDSVMMEFDALIGIEKVIMKRLNAPEDYADTTNREFLLTQIERHSTIYNKLQDFITKLVKVKEAESNQLQIEIKGSFGQIRQQIIIVSLVSILLSLVFAYLMAKSITEPINYIKELIKMLSMGVLPDEAGSLKFDDDDEIGHMTQSVAHFVKSIRAKTVFAQEIGREAYDTDFEPLSAEDLLGNALLTMRNNLKQAHTESSERKWTNEGLILVQDVIRRNQNDLSKLADELLQRIIKYFGANQGGLFILSKDEQDEKCLELESCYAWGKKKHLKKRVYKGEGLTGQCWEEGELLHLSDVPSDYIEITSGLGQALPNFVVIAPLMLNNIVMGMIEIASFKQLASYQIEFLKKLGESVASTFSILSNDAQSKRLVEESNSMMQQIAAQEEEMRQNLEELTSTQEEMARTQYSLQSKTAAFSQCFMTLELDEEKNVLEANDYFYSTMKFVPSEVLGRTAYLLFEDEEATLDSGLKHILKGEKWLSVIQMKNRAGIPQLVSMTGNALKSRKGYIEKYFLVLSHLEYAKPDLKNNIA